MNRTKILQFARQLPKESLRREFKRSDSLLKALPGSNSNSDEGRIEIAKDIVAFANKLGGAIFYGITNEGEIEGCDFKPRFDEIRRMIEQVSHDMIGPPLACGCEISSLAGEGDVVIVSIPIRAGIPHARIRKNYREYHIRTIHGNRHVPDSVLELLFRDRQQVEIVETFDAVLNYAKVGPPFGYMLGAPSGYIWYAHLVQDLCIKDLASLRSGNPRETLPEIALFIELAPYALLRSLAWGFASPWQKRIGRYAEEHPWENAPEMEMCDVTQLSIPDSPPTIDALGCSIAAVLQMPQYAYPQFQVLKGTTVRVLHGGQTGAQPVSTLELSHPEFKCSVEFRSKGWGLGIHWKHPLNQFGRMAGPLSHPKLDYNDFGCLVMRCTLSAAFDITETQQDGFGSRRIYVEALQDHLHQAWDWDRYIEGQPDRHLVALTFKIDQLSREIERLTGLLEPAGPTPDP